MKLKGRNGFIKSIKVCKGSKWQFRCVCILCSLSIHPYVGMICNSKYIYSYMKFCIVCLESRKIIVQICDITIYQEPNICDISCDISLYTSIPIYGLFKSYPIVLHFSQVLSESRRQSVLPPQSLQSESWAGQKVVDKYLGDRQFWPYRWRGSLSFYNVFNVHCSCI